MHTFYTNLTKPQANNSPMAQLATQSAKELPSESPLFLQSFEISLVKCYIIEISDVDDQKLQRNLSREKC